MPIASSRHPTDPDQRGRKIRGLVEGASLAAVGLEMGLSVAIGWGAGFWLDKKLGTQPWLMLTCLLLGVAAGFRGLIRAAGIARRAAAERESGSEGEGSRRSAESK